MGYNPYERMGDRLTLEDRIKRLERVTNVNGIQFEKDVRQLAKRWGVEVLDVDIEGQRPEAEIELPGSIGGGMFVLLDDYGFEWEIYSHDNRLELW